MKGGASPRPAKSNRAQAVADRRAKGANAGNAAWGADFCDIAMSVARVAGAYALAIADNVRSFEVEEVLVGLPRREDETK